MIKMKKFPIITILALFLFAISVSAVPNFSIVEDSVNLTGTVGQTKSSSFTVNNTGTTNLDINFTGYTLTKGSDQLSISDLSNITNLTNGATQSKTFSVVIPSQKPVGLYTGTLTATSNASNTDTITINVNVTPTYSVSTEPSEMNLGSATLNTTKTSAFNITNIGNADIISISFGFSDSDFNLQANKTNFTLAFNKTEAIRFNITIPADFSTGNVTLGKVKLISNELNIDLFVIKANVGGGLIIEDLDVFLITRKSESGSDLDIDDGRKLNFDPENAGPGSELRFNFNIENTFADDQDIDINDIIIKVTIEEIDDGEDIEEESDEFDLDSDTNQDVDVFVNIPLSVNEGIYDVVIEVEGEDVNGNKHTVQMNLKLDIDKEGRDVIISKLSLFPETVKCTGSSTLTATIKNLGSRIEDDAKLEIVNSDLNINFVQRNIELEEDPFDVDNEFTKSIIINVGKGIEARTYPIEVKAYIQEEILWETKTINLVVEDCAGEQEEEEINETEETLESGVEQEEEIIEGEEIPVLKPATTTEVSLTKRPGFWAAIIVLNIIVIAGIAFLIMKFVVKK